MKKRTIKCAFAIVAIAILAAVYFVLATDTMPAHQVMTVDGSPVLEEEFLLLLRENTVQYEGQLRKEHNIPTGQSVRAYFDGAEGEYRRHLLEQNIAQLTYVRIEQALATEYGVAPKFTYESFLEELDAENRQRADSIAKGEPVYGLQSFSPEQYYNYKMSNLTTAVIDALPEELLTVTDEEMMAYYQGMDSFANIDGEVITYTMYDITAAEELSAEAQGELYSDIMTTLTERTYADVTVEHVTCRAEQCAFTPRELRDFVKQSFDGEILLSLSEHEVFGPFDLGSVSYMVQYNGFERAETIAPNDREVFARVLRKEAYQRLIAEKTAQAKVKINQTWLDSYLGGTDLTGT